MSVKQFKYIVINTFNTGSSWVENNSGVQVVHIPSGMIFECSDKKSAHANKIECMRALNEWLLKQGLEQCGY